MYKYVLQLNYANKSFLKLNLSNQNIDWPCLTNISKHFENWYR